MPEQGAEWWYAVGNAKRGPVTTESIRTALMADEITSDTPIWQKGMSVWTRLEEIAAFKEFCNDMPPPLFVGEGARSFDAPKFVSHKTILSPARPPTINSHGRDSTPSGQTKGFTQTFGLDVRVAILAVIVDTLAAGLTDVSLGLFYFVELIAGVILSIITYKIQSHWYGDDHNSSLIKSLVVGLLTAIPAPVTWIFAAPAGVVGLVKVLQGKGEIRR